MPGDWARVGEFRKLLLLRALRPDRITNALQVGVGTGPGPGLAWGSAASRLAPGRLANAPCSAATTPPLCQAYCEGVMGSEFVKQDAFDPAIVLAESSRCLGVRGVGRSVDVHPLLVVLSAPGPAQPCTPGAHLVVPSPPPFPPSPLPPPSTTPIFFILFPGYSPSKDIEAFARSTGRSPEAGTLTLISMGQGQEGPAEAVLNK
jgi:hypothetical protein